MKRTEKVAMVEDLSRAFQEHPHFILTEYSGLTVNEATELRRRIRRVGGRYRVLKNRLAKRAAQGTPMEHLIEQLQGPRAIAFHQEDPVTLAKELAEFAKEHPKLTLVAAVVDAKDVLDAEGVKALASLPSLPELRAQLLALIQTPATMLARLLQTPAAQLVRVLDARREHLEGAGGEG